jgi:hypothetical protein
MANPYDDLFARHLVIYLNNPWLFTESPYVPSQCVFRSRLTAENGDPVDFWVTVFTPDVTDAGDTLRATQSNRPLHRRRYKNVAPMAHVMFMQNFT